jgi:hypothetical protein
MTPGYIPVKQLFTRTRLTRLRRAKLLPYPAYVKGVACYSDEVLADLADLLATGNDEWIMREHGRGRPALAEIARLAGV